MINEIIIEIKAIREQGRMYVMSTGYSIDGKGYPEYEPTKEEAKKLVKMCTAASKSLKRVYG